MSGRRPGAGPVDGEAPRRLLRVEGPGAVEFHPCDEQRLTAERAAAGRINEVRVAVEACRAGMHPAARTAAADPPTPQNPVDGAGIGTGGAVRVTAPSGGSRPGVMQDRREVVAARRALQRHDHR